MSMKIVQISVMLAAMAGAGSATDHVVGPAGSGAPFTSIQAAVDAAQPGDRILVLAGTYNGAVVVDKAIELIGSGSSATTSQALATFPGLIPVSMTIGNIAAGARVRVANIRFTFVGAMSAPNPAMMIVHDCPGRVEIGDVVLEAASLPAQFAPALGGTLWVRDCAQVVASDLRVTGNPTTFPFPTSGDAIARRGMSGVLVERSSLWMADCAAEGNATRFMTTGFGGSGGDGLTSIDSYVHVASSVLRGAQSGGMQNGIAGAGGAGIHATGSSLVVHGAAGNQVRGADAFAVVAGSSTGLGAAGSAIALDAASSLVHAVDVVFAPGAASGSLPAAPPIFAVPGAAVIAAPVKLPSVSMPAFVPLGGGLLVEIAGEPGIDHIRAVALSTAASQSYAGIFGLVLVDLPTLVTIHVETLSAAGTGSIQLTVPLDPWLAGIVIVEQAAQVHPGVIVLSPPVLCSLGF